MAYIYCDECEEAQPAPWNMKTVELLSFIILDDFELRCKYCDTVIRYDREQFIDEIAERIDK